MKKYCVCVSLCETCHVQPFRLERIFIFAAINNANGCLVKEAILKSWDETQSICSMFSFQGRSLEIKREEHVQGSRIEWAKEHGGGYY